MAGLEFNETRFLGLLEKLIGEAEFVQNRPPHNIPQESRVGQHVLKQLAPYTVEHGGKLSIKVIEFAPSRNNIIITYPGSTDKVVSFVGCHMDVVPANPEEWSFDPFKLTREGDQLRGRGTTDCLGHVALVTEIFTELGEKKPDLAVTVVGVFIANEENSEIAGVGVDGLVKHGHIDNLKNGWMYWIDSADKQPCVGTGTMMSWELKAHGRMGHSGLPYDAINPLLLSYEALMVLMGKFHDKYGAHPKEAEYRFASPSTMKPTIWEQPPGAINQIPATATIKGDIRMTPFWDAFEARKDLEAWAAEINGNIAALPGRGPRYGYDLGATKGRIEFKFLDDEPYLGIACDMTSPGFKALSDCTKEVLGSVQHYSITGSLPIVRDLQKAGYDLQVTGYGLTKTYHAVNEYAELSGMKQGFAILTKVLDTLNAHTKGQ